MAPTISAIERMAGSAHCLAARTAKRRQGVQLRRLGEISLEEYADVFKRTLLRRYGSAVRAWHELLERDGSGTVTEKEFCAAYVSLQIPGKALDVFHLFDADGTGSITMSELLHEFDKVEPEDAGQSTKPVDPTIAAMRVRTDVMLKKYRKCIDDTNLNVQAFMDSMETLMESQASAQYAFFAREENPVDQDNALQVVGFDETKLDNDLFDDLLADVETRDWGRGEDSDEDAPQAEPCNNVYYWAHELECWVRGDQASQPDPSPDDGEAGGRPEFPGLLFGAWAAVAEGMPSAGQRAVGDPVEGCICGAWRDFSFFAVVSGHGLEAVACRQVVERELPMVLFQDWPGRSTLDDQPTPKQVGDMLRAAFTKLHEAVRFACPALFSGASLEVAVLQGRDAMWCASVGDSRTCAGVHGRYHATAIPVSELHTPAVVEEFERISKSGGEVRLPRGDTSYRVFVPGENYPALSITRSLGDLLGHTIGLSATAMVTYLPLADVDFIVLASRGIWNKVSMQSVCNLAMYASHEARTYPDLPARALVQEASTRSRAWHGCVCDAAALVVVVRPENLTGNLPSAFGFGARPGTAADLVRRNVSPTPRTGRSPATPSIIDRDGRQTVSPTNSRWGKLERF